MQEIITNILASVGSAVATAIIILNYLPDRKKKEAECKKLEAETNKMNEETRKLKLENDKAEREQRIVQ
ncbi:hypothetical protein [Paenibacillus odorifer]|uniref:hypothetical protein n=1 Tax=Paenibacillus odorifer TaxID=189426 RepID=UPI00096D1D0B|nr:hypothetical protein [Paenibacillus odorifer]OMD66666.1 hypothetical protein BSK50_30665 [Paenibacillus odorifer]